MFRSCTTKDSSYVPYCATEVDASTLVATEYRNCEKMGKLTSDITNELIIQSDTFWQANAIREPDIAKNAVPSPGRVSLIRKESAHTLMPILICLGVQLLMVIQPLLGEQVKSTGTIAVNFVVRLPLPLINANANKFFSYSWHSIDNWSKLISTKEGKKKKYCTKSTVFLTSCP